MSMGLDAGEARVVALSNGRARAAERQYDCEREQPKGLSFPAGSSLTGERWRRISVSLQGPVWRASANRIGMKVSWGVRLDGRALVRYMSFATGSATKSVLAGEREQHWDEMFPWGGPP